MTDEAIQKLEEAFLMSLSDREACLFAGMAPSTLYAYCQENPEFSERKELLKEQVKIAAKKNISEAINAGDKPLSQWYLERKAKSEFSPRVEQTGADGAPLQANLIMYDNNNSAASVQPEAVPVAPTESAG